MGCQADQENLPESGQVNRPVTNPGRNIMKGISAPGKPAENKSRAKRDDLFSPACFFGK
jgi:hypothetical protein